MHISLASHFITSGVKTLRSLLSATDTVHVEYVNNKKYIQHFIIISKAMQNLYSVHSLCELVKLLSSLSLSNRRFEESQV